jgi:hypothetical protein
VKEREDGSIDVIMEQAQGAMARDVARGRGPMAFAVKKYVGGDNLRG